MVRRDVTMTIFHIKIAPLKMLILYILKFMQLRESMWKYECLLCTCMYENFLWIQSYIFRVGNNNGNDRKISCIISFSVHLHSPLYISKIYYNIFLVIFFIKFIKADLKFILFTFFSAVFFLLSVFIWCYFQMKLAVLLPHSYFIYHFQNRCCFAWFYLPAIYSLLLL